MSEGKKIPPGVVAILIYPDGGEVASVSDFNLAGYGGCTLEEAQTMRAKRALSFAVIDALCSHHVAKVMEIHRCDEIVDAMVRKLGFRRVIVPIGHEAEASSE